MSQLAPPAQASPAPLLQVRDLRTEFVTENGLVQAVNGVSFHVNKGETLALVGESGSGKSVTMLTLMRLLESPPARVAGGKVLFDGVDLLQLEPTALRAVRGGRIAMIFQDPMTSLNPVFTVGDQIAETLRVQRRLAGRAARQRVIELLDLVGLPEPARAVDDYPHQLSGGMRQRTMIAMALACDPALLIADEPTTALDVTVQEQILTLVRDLRERLGMAVIWITHDLGVVAGLADRVNVMYAGSVVEAGPVSAIYTAPRHPYTLGLLHSIPRLDRSRAEPLQPIPGVPPDLARLPAGCPFAPRCGYVEARCRLERPPLLAVEPDHWSACWVNPPAGAVAGAGPVS